MVRLRFVLIAVVLGIATVWGQTPVGTAFVYQGRLTDGGVPATGAYDFRVRLFDAALGGNLVGSPNTVHREDVAVASGTFLLSLDFGTAAFGASKRWLEIGVRPGASTEAFTVLAPRQEVTPTPNALVASSITGVLPVANGGTGSTSQNFVDLTAGQTIGGAKTFSSAPSFVALAAPFNVASTGIVPNLNADLLDGTHASAFQRRYQSVRVVAKSGGDYTDPLAAMNDVSSWCPSPTSGDPCLLKIMPGTYDIGANSLQMRENVHIEGSGMSSTVIKGALDSGTSGLVSGARNTELRHVTVLNLFTGGAAANAMAIYNDGNNWFYLDHVDARALYAANASGIHQVNDAATFMNGVTAKARGSSNSYGIYSSGSSVDITDLEVHVDGGGSNFGIRLYTTDNYVPYAEIRHARVTVSNSNAQLNYGIYNRNVALAVNGAEIDVSYAKVYNYGVYNLDGNFLANVGLRDVVADVEGAAAFGVFNTNTGGNLTLDHSDIKATTNSIRNDNAAKTFRVGASKLTGTAWGTVKCVHSYNDSYNPLNSSCVP